MNHPNRLAHPVAALVLAVALLAPWPAAAQAPSAGLCAVAAGNLPAPVELLARAWGLVSRLWSKEGCSIDPHGVKARCGLDPHGLKAGANLDPHGSPSATSAVPSDTDARCTLDPHGACITSRSLPETDAGCTADPHGACG